MNKSKIFAIVTLSYSILALSACGNVGSYDRTKISTNYSTQSSASGGTTGNGYQNYLSEDPNYSCPLQSNVNPSYDPSVTALYDHFTACTNKYNQTDIVVHGETSRSTTICAFPVQYVNDQQIVWIKDSTTNKPIVKCQSPESGKDGIYIRMTTSQYNALIIVESPDESAMSNCLSTGNRYACPLFSFGKIR